MQEETPSAKTPVTATTTATPPPLEQAPSQPQSSQQQTSRTPAASPTSPATPAAATPTISAVAADGDGDGDGEDGFLADEDIDEDHAFGDVLLSVQSIKAPPEMEITVNRRSGTPAAAAKVAAESENVLEEWAGEGPMNSSESHRQQQGFRWEVLLGWWRP